MTKNVSKRAAKNVAQTILGAVASAIMSGKLTDEEKSANLTIHRNGGYRLTDLVLAASRRLKTMTVTAQDLLKVIRTFWTSERVARLSHRGYLLVTDKKRLLQYASP